MNNLLRFGIMLYITAQTFAVTAQDSIPKNILFVGNSYTYFWNLPQTVHLMAKAKKIDITTRQSTAGGANLGEHWQGKKNLKSVEIIKNGNFDAVVLQDHSMRTIVAKDSMMKYGQLLNELIKNKGAKRYVYMTWARDWNPLMQETITKGYIELAQKIGAEVVPVGLAWQMARQLRPNLPIYDPDGSHPSSLGTYLTGCVFYGILTGQSPVGLPHRLFTTDANDEKLYISINSPNDALFCQQVAEKTIRMFRKRF